MKGALHPLPKIEGWHAIRSNVGPEISVNYWRNDIYLLESRDFKTLYIRKLPKSQHYLHYHSPSTWNNETSLFKTKRAQKNMRAWVYQLSKTWIRPWIELELKIMLLLQFSQKRLGDKDELSALIFSANNFNLLFLKDCEAVVILAD